MARGGLGRLLRRGYPRLAGALLDVATDEPPNHLGGRGVLFGAQALEESLFPGVDQGSESGSAVFAAQAGSRDLRYVSRILL